MLVDLRADARARQYLNDYMRLHPEDTVATLLAARAALAEKDTQRAEELLATQDSWGEQIEMAAMVTAVLEWQKSQSEQAEKQLAELQGDPAVGLLSTRYLGQIAFEKGEPIRGTRLLEAAIDKSEGVDRLQIVEDLVSALDTANLELEADGLLRARMGELGVVGHVMLTDRQLKQERHAAAIASGTAGLESFPRESELRYLRGMASFLMGNSADAKVDFEAATDLNPDHSRAWISLAKLSHDRGGHGGPGRHDDVIAIYEEALEKSPHNAIIEIELGKVAQEEGRPEDAEKWYRAALFSAPSDPLAQSTLAILLVEQGRVDEAIEFADSALATLPNHHQVLFAKGRASLAKGDARSAAALLIAANTSRPEHGHSLAYASHALNLDGQGQKAAEVAREALYMMLREDEVAMARDVLMSVSGSNSLEASLNRIEVGGIFEDVGTLTVMDTPMGLKLDITLTNAQPGNNSIHLHENPSCAPGYRDDVLIAGLSAGAHLGGAKMAGGGHAHHMPPADKNGDDMAESKAPMQMVGPMVMAMAHGGHTMNMVMRSGDLPIGDLPSLMGDAKGNASMSVFVPYLHSSMLKDRSVIVHKGTDAQRAFCGVIQAR